MNGRSRLSRKSGATALTLAPELILTKSPPAAPITPQQRSQRSKKRQAERDERLAKLRASAPAMPESPDDGLSRVMLSPELAMTLLEHNTLNRPISQSHVERIAKQIVEHKWKFNGDTIKISQDQQVLDGQHRLWAVIEAKINVETVIVYGLSADAFATIDTIRRLRSGGDTIALSGKQQYRNQIAMALTWLLRHQRGVIDSYKQPQNRIENSDIQKAFVAHPQIERAVEAAMKLRQIGNPAIIAFAYYVLSNWNQEVAEAMIRIMRDPSATNITHPFFRLRSYFLTDKHVKKDPITTIALIFKAANAAREGREIQVLAWRSQGLAPEAFPQLAA